MRSVFRSTKGMSVSALVSARRISDCSREWTAKMDEEDGCGGGGGIILYELVPLY